MKNSALLVFLVAVTACGKDSNKSDTAPPALLGSWALALNANCSQVLTFKAASYANVLICVQDANHATAEVEAGSLTFTDNSLTTVATKYSCPGEPLDTEQDGYTVTGGGTGLTLNRRGGVALLTKVDTSQAGPSTSVTYGCFDSNTGAFTPNPSFSLKEVK